MRIVAAVGLLGACGALMWLGCGDDETVGAAGAAGMANAGAGGMPSTASTGGMPPTTTTGGTMSTCSGPPDAECDPDVGEDCTCEDCAMIGYCVPGNCDAENGECHLIHDSCVCPDCDINVFCSDPADGNCTDDSVCEPYIESCSCADCYNDPKCTDNVAACEGGAVDDICGTTEDCLCPDCMGTVRCVLRHGRQLRRHRQLPLQRLHHRALLCQELQQ